MFGFAPKIVYILEAQNIEMIEMKETFQILNLSILFLLNNHNHRPVCLESSVNISILQISLELLTFLHPFPATANICRGEQGKGGSQMYI